MYKRWFLSILFSFRLLVALGQNTSAGLEVIPEDVSSINQILKSLDQAAADSQKVLYYVKLSRIYWYKNTIANKDSSIYYAAKAREACTSKDLISLRMEAIFMICKALAEKNDISGAENLIASVYGEERVRLLLVVAEHFIFSIDKSDNKEEKGLPYLFTAISLSENIKSEKWKHEGLMLLSKYYFSKGDFELGKANVLKIIKDYHASGDKKMEAHYWSELGLYMPETDSTYHDKISYHKAAYELYYKLKQYKDAAYTLRDIAVINKNHNKLDTAEKLILKVLAMLRTINSRPSFTTYRIAGDIFRIKGDYANALTYVLEAMNTPEILIEKKMNGYETLGDIYSELGLPKKSFYYYKMVLDYAISTSKPGIFLLCHKVIREQINSGNAINGLKFLRKFVAVHPPSLAIHKELIFGSFGDVYAALHRFKDAEHNYHQMIAYDKLVQKELKKEIGDHNSISGSEAYFTITGSEAYYKIGKFYTTFGLYKEAKPYLSRSLTSTPNLPSIARVRDIENLLFKVDSAAGDYLSAINHFQEHKRLNDSIFNAAKSKQFSELQIKYETTQNEQSMRFLQIKNKNQQTELQKVNLQRNITIAGIGMLFIIAGVTFHNYRNKQRVNRILELKQSQLEHKQSQLESKQKEINDKNLSLENLILDKDQLLTEKDWLLKEIHHRVKNNLQIVISLLNAQSNFLSQGPVLSALQESQNRIQAIALIHQKLYASTMTSSIDMGIYINELVSYLKECFDICGRRINIQLVSESVFLDISLAIPLGLILNETVTNSIKYAFDDLPGEILIVFKKNKENFSLSVCDNGKGLPEGFDVRNANTMGMEMIKALSDQLSGSLIVDSNMGTRIEIVFPQNTDE